MAVIGFAAFSPSGDDGAAEDIDVTEVPLADVQASARVASAVLALRVSDADSRTATTDTIVTTTDVAESSAIVEQATVADETTSSTSTPPPTTVAPSTTAEPTTTATPDRDTTPPTLRVTSPDDGDTVNDRVVTFKGVTEPGASVASGPYGAEVAEDGTWSLQLVLAPGANGASFTAKDNAGNEESVRLTITYEPPAPPATTTTTQPTTTTTSGGSTAPKWSPLWPADAGGKRNVEAWRSLVAKHWPAELVECALNVIDLESQGDPRAYNAGSSAEGLFQHLSKYWKGRAAAAGFKDGDGLYATPFNAEANIAAAWVIARGSTPWHRPWTVDPFYGACQE